MRFHRRRRTHLSPLDAFRAEVIASIGILGIELKITDDRGHFPVVAALDDEPVEVLLRRIAGVGGNATVFSHGRSVRSATVVNVADALDPLAGEDLASEGNRPGRTASVGALLDYLRLKSDGVQLSITFDAAQGVSEVGEVREVPAFR